MPYLAYFWVVVLKALNKSAWLAFSEGGATSKSIVCVVGLVTFCFCFACLDVGKFISERLEATKLQNEVVSLRNWSFKCSIAAVARHCMLLLLELRQIWLWQSGVAC